MTTSETEPLSRKERERERHRAEILDAAERIFGRKGYHAATVEEIAKEAQFAVGTLYNLFKGKEDLYARVIDKQVQQFVLDFESQVMPQEDPAAAIAAVIRLRLTHFDEHRDFIRIALELSPACRLDPTSALPLDLAEVHDRLIGKTTEIFKRGIEKGVFDDADPLYYTLLLEGICNAFIAYWAKHPPKQSLQVRITKLAIEFIGRIRMRLDRSAQNWEAPAGIQALEG